MNRACEIKFEEKLINSFKDIQIYFESDSNERLNQNEREELVGFNNAIVYVLSLLNPKYEFEI